MKRLHPSGPDMEQPDTIRNNKVWQLLEGLFLQKQQHDNVTGQQNVFHVRSNKTKPQWKSFSSIAL